MGGFVHTGHMTQTPKMPHPETIDTVVDALRRISVAAEAVNPHTASAADLGRMLDGIGLIARGCALSLTVDPTPDQAEHIGMTLGALVSALHAHTLQLMADEAGMVN